MSTAHHVGGLIVLVIGLALYGSTLHPSVAGGDSGELMVTSHELATPHPPGYPTFALSTHLFGHGIYKVMEAFGLQTGNRKPAFLQDQSSGVGEDGSIRLPYGGGLAYAMNVFHGCVSAASLLVIYWAVVVSGGSSLGGILAATMFGFAPNVWTYAIGTEVFPLNNLFSAIILLLATYFDKLVETVTTKPSTTARFVHMASFLCGIALTNQHTSVLFVCPIVLWVFFTFPACWRDTRQLAINTICFFSGLAPYIYIPISNYINPSPNSWGRSLSVGDFMKHFLRTEYGTFSLASQEATYKESNFGRNTKYFLLDMIHQIGAVLILLAVFAVWKVAVSVYTYAQRSKKPSTTTALKKQQQQQQSVGNKKGSNESTSTVSTQQTTRLPSLQIALLLMWTLYVNFFNYFSNLPIEQPLFYGVQQRFWIQPLIITVFMAGHGFTLVQREATAYISVNQRWVVSAISVIVVGVLVTLQIYTHYDEHSESDNLFVRDSGFALINPLPPGSVVLSKGDIVINAIRFVQNFEEFRRDDVLVLDQEMMTYKWYIDNIKEWIALREARAAARGCNTSTTTPAHCETDRDAIFTKYFGGWKFPGVGYFPGRPNFYTMVDLIRVNVKDGRRFFTALGFKEGDPTSNFFYTRNFGLTQEILQSHVIVQQQVNPLYQTKDTTAQINKLLKNPQELLLKPSKDGGRTPAPTGDLPSQVVGVVDPITILEIADTLPEFIYRGVSGGGGDGGEQPPSTKKYLKLPPPGRYAPHTWEAVILNDFQQAYFNMGLMFMSVSHFMAQYLNEKMSDAPLMKAVIRSVVATIHRAQEDSSSSDSGSASTRPSPLHTLAVMNQHDSEFRTRVSTYPSFLLAPIFGERFLEMVLTHFNSSQLEYNAIRNMGVIYQHLSDIINTLQNVASMEADKEMLSTFRKALVQEKLLPTFRRLLAFPEHETLTHSQLRDVITYYKRTI